MMEGIRSFEVEIKLLEPTGRSVCCRPHLAEEAFPCNPGPRAPCPAAILRIACLP